MKKTIFEIISDIQQDLNNNASLNKNNEDENNIPTQIKEKYNNFKKWLD